MLVKKKGMPKKVNIFSGKLFSLQLKKALFYAFLEARRQKINVIDSQLLLFGLLKTNDSSINRLFQKIYKTRTLSQNPIEKLINKLKVNFQFKSESITFSVDREFPNFSRPVKRLLFFLVRLGKKEQVTVITTLQVLTHLLRHKSLAKLVKDSLIMKI
uniref:N-domain of Clp chaperone n=1 Tax=Characiopsis acuta TaxID=2040456 RepID=A0A3R5QQU8_9STRA|nr:N-domain of Clp chaperone [Characiopsis acuta]QAA11270.1 N-domain of Clp chaperone [Characiopsis acuta]